MLIILDRQNVHHYIGTFIKVRYIHPIEMLQSGLCFDCIWLAKFGTQVAWLLITRNHHPIVIAVSLHIVAHLTSVLPTK